MFNRYLWYLCFGHLVVDLGQGVLPILTPYLAESLDLSYFQVGIIALAYNFSSAIIQPVFGVLSDRYHMPWLMPFGLFLSGFGLALTGIGNSYAFLLFAVLLAGLGVAGYHPEASKVVHLISDEDRAGSSMAIFSVGGNLGFGLGPLLATVVLSFSSVQGVMIPGALAALFFVFLLPRFKKMLAESMSKRESGEKQPAVGRSRKVSLTLLLLYVTVRSWMHSGLIYFIPFYFAGSEGIASPEYLVSTFLIAGAIGTVLGGPFADRFGGRNGLLVSMIVSLIAVYPFLYLNGPWIFFFAFVMGASLISTFSTTVVFGQRLLPHSLGLASGLMLGFAVGMGSIGVTLLGVVADYMGLSFTMNVISLLPILGIVLALPLPDIRGRVSSTTSQS